MKLIKMLALSYLIKTVLLGVAWLFIPDLPERATAFARSAWAYVDFRSAPADAAPSAAVPTQR